MTSATETSTIGTSTTETSATGAARLAGLKPALQRFLAQAAGATSADITTMSPLTGGAIQENWLLTANFAAGPMSGTQELVLRTDADSGVAASLSRAQEFAVLCAAWQGGVLVPEPLWLCEDSAIIGKPFYVMRRVSGTALGRTIVKDTELGGDRQALARRLGEELAKIHQIAPPRDDLAFLDFPVLSPAQDAVLRYRTYLDGLGIPHPALEWGLRWCELNAPPIGDVTLVHQDFRTGNYMVDGSGLTAVLDWEFCAWGDPLSDLGWFCAACWRFGRDDLEAGGIANREPFYQGYEEVSGRKIDAEAMIYWELMAHIRWAVIALQQGARTLSGKESSLDLALTGRVYPAALQLTILDATTPEKWSQA